MATLEEVSERLMQPATDLADWNFPLATVLQEYYTLLKEQEEVNFSHAALVLQNSADVYARRLEYLFHDVSVLDESFAEHEAQEAAHKESKKRAKNKRTLIDLGDFEPIDSTKFIGKNINMKARIGNKHAVKLLTQRFPQLEISRSSLPIEVYDIHGDVIGEKYAFRCNEYPTASGLVEHLTPEDFLDSSPAQSTSFSTSFANSDLEASLGTAQPTVETEIGFSGSVLSEDNCEDSRVVQETDPCLLDASFASSYDSGVGSSIQSSKTRPDSAFSNSADSHWDLLQSRPGSSLSSADENSLVGEDSSPLDDLEEAILSNEKTVESPEETSGNASQVEDFTLENITNENRVEISDCVTNEETKCASGIIENTPTTQNIAVNEKIADIRRSSQRVKTSKNPIDAVNRLNPEPWEPISFDGIPEKVSKARAEFKLPCPISLLQSRKTRKRKVTPGKQKKKDVKRRATTEGSATPNKMTTYSPTRQLFLQFKKEELEELQMGLEECLKNRPNLDAFHYKAVMTDNSLDLLGYRSNDQKSDIESNSHIEPDFPTTIPTSDVVTDEILTNVIDATENIESTESAIDDFPMPDTPESSYSASEMSVITPPPTYRSRVEKSVRDICHSADVRTVEEEAVIKWHEYMEPRLKEVERRSPFDVKQYSARVIDKIKSKPDKKIEFADMVSNEKPTEVARYFLASLQLANEYNLHIDTNHNVEGNFTLALFDKDR